MTLLVTFDIKMHWVFNGMDLKTEQGSVFRYKELLWM